MHTHVVLLALCVALLAPGPGVRAAEEKPDPFMLAVLRRDGLLIPFAAFNGRRWAGRWPQRVPLEVPISLDDVPDSWWGIEPPPRRMSLWKEGVRSGEVNLRGPNITGLMCRPGIALRSDYKAAEPVPPRFVLPYPKDGLLVAGDVPVAKIDSVESGGAEANGVLALATDEFNKQEDIAARAFTSWKHPVKRDRRKLVPITVEALYRAPTDDPEWTAYFIEAVRQFPPGPEDKDGCGLATYASGWVVTGPKGRAKVQLGARVTYCDRKGAGYMLPFGLIRANGKAYWVFQYAGFESESYEVVRPSRGGADVEIVFNAGMCAR